MPRQPIGLRLHMTTAAPTRASVGLRSDRGPILGSVMLSIALIAIDATILATAVPAIVRDLGGFTQFPWLFSAYLLTQAISTPIYGKLADTFGRKPLMLFGILTFVVGSVLCALSWSMGALIAFRALQGLGAGAIQPAGMTIMGDIYSVAERAVAQGYIASVWAMSAVVGPTLGGLFSDHLSWRWIFWINLPLGLLAAAVLWIRFDENPERCSWPVRPRCCCWACSRAASAGRGGPGRARSRSAGRPRSRSCSCGSRAECRTLCFPVGCSGTGSSTPRRWPASSRAWSCWASLPTSPSTRSRSSAPARRLRDSQSLRWR